MSDVKFDIVHASLDTFMSDDKNEEDVKNLLAMHCLLYTLTETADEHLVQIIRDYVRDEADDYLVVNPDDGDVLFIVRRDASVITHGGPLAIRATHGIDAAHGAHSSRRNSFVRFRYRHETITHTGVHFVVAHPPAAPHMDRTSQQVKQARLMGEQMVKFGRGRNIATGSGDLNASLPGKTAVQRQFDKYGLTTTAEERHDKTGTHGNARLDYIWTYDDDARVSCIDHHVYKSAVFNSDHDPVRATIQIKQNP